MNWRMSLNAGFKQEDIRYLKKKLDAFQIVAGWWGHQPRQSAMGGGDTAHSNEYRATIWNAPVKIADQFGIKIWL